MNWLRHIPGTRYISMYTQSYSTLHVRLTAVNIVSMLVRCRYFGWSFCSPAVPRTRPTGWYGLGT